MYLTIYVFNYLAIYFSHLFIYLDIYSFRYLYIYNF